MGKLAIEEFADRVNEAMAVISREFLRHQTEDFYKIKITMPQIIVLDNIYRHGELKMTDLARVLNVTTAAVTGLCDRLVRDGYAERVSDPNDRRVVKIRLTAEGKKIMRHVHEHRKKAMIKMFGVISQEERESYLSILEHMKEHLSDESGRNK
jgi:DNA-binding MarR family transcriptional regulator